MGKEGKLQWNLKIMELKLNRPWSIARGSAKHKTNFIIEVRSGNQVGFGEVAPNLRYGETPEKIVEQFEYFLKVFRRAGRVDTNKCCQSLSFGIQSALSHMVENDDYHIGVEDLDRIARSRSIPIMEPCELAPYLKSCAGSDLFKVKVTKNTAQSTLKKVASLTPKSLIVDANESFESLESYHKFEELAQRVGVKLIEQPFPANRIDLYTEARKLRSIPIFADESLTNQKNLETLAKFFDGVNIKLMKSGSYETAIEQFRSAKNLGLGTMLGCMIETGLGISSAARLVQFADYIDLDGHTFLQEDPFGTLLENCPYSKAS